MLIIPNLGAEQPLQNNAPVARLQPFAARAMASLFPKVEHNFGPHGSVGERRIAPNQTQSYLPADIQELYEPNSVFAFLNTPEIVELARQRSTPLIGHPNALTFHRRDWLHLHLRDQEGFESSVEDCITLTFAGNSRESVITEAAQAIERTPSLQSNRTWKPYFSAGGSGRCAGQGPTLSSEELRFLRDTTHIGLCLEPWRQRTRDYSSQFWLTDNGVAYLSSTIQYTTPAGRYRGLSTIWNPNAEPQFEATTIPNAHHHIVAKQLFNLGYRGPLGFDGFEFRTNGVLLNRPICEMNARLTMAHLLIADQVSRFAPGPTAERHVPLEVRLPSGFP